MSASRTIPSRSPTITPHIETVCANNTRICPTNSDKRASSPLYPGSMASNSISVSVNLNAAPDTAESNYLPLQNLCWRGGRVSDLRQSQHDTAARLIECSTPKNTLTEKRSIQDSPLPRTLQREHSSSISLG